VIWHIVRFDTSAHDEATRRELIAKLEALTDLDVVAWLRVAPDIEDPTVVGLITGFRDADDLATYRVHPDHVPVVEWVRGQGIVTVRLDIPSDDDPDELP
jgi:hypothetical protein